MIKSFSCERTNQLFNDIFVKKFEDFENIARRKLAILEAAENLFDLQSPPGNRLEKLRGERAGQCSIRVNRQYRICFTWKDNAAWSVEIVDYHS